MNLFQHFTVLLVVLCALTLLTAEARGSRQGRRKRLNRKSKGKNKNDQSPQVNEKRPQVKEITVCPLNQTCDDDNGCGKTAAKLTGKDAVVELQANLELQAIPALKVLKISLKELVDAKSFDGKDDVYPGYGTKELNPTDKTKLSSDTKFKLLGQMTWWLTWIEASLRILQEIRLRVVDKKRNPDDIVPVAKDGNGNEFTIDSTLNALLQVTDAVNGLHSKLGHDMNTKAKSPFSCQTVRVMQACRKKKPDCSKERDRAYILLRDAHKAVDKMLKALSECKVEEKDEHKELALVCKRNVIFSKCQKTLCGIQKKRCKCLSWTYE